MEDNFEIEQRIIGKIAQESDIFYQYHDRLHSELFDVLFHKQIFDKICEIYKRAETPDIVKISKELKLDNLESAELAEILRYGTFHTDIEYAIQVLQESYNVRKLHGLNLELHSRIQESLPSDEITSFVEKELSSIREGGAEKEGTLQDLLIETMEDISRRMEADGITGVTTGFHSLDKFTGGWQETDLIIVGGASSMGKTSFALALAYNAANAAIPTLIFSYEMSGKQLLGRLISSGTEINNRHIQQGAITIEEHQRINNFIGEIENKPLYIDECKKTSLTYLMNKIKKNVLLYGVKLVFVDYLQLVSSFSKQGTREQEVSKVARNLKNLARKLNITIIALSQLNRGVSNRSSSRPNLSDLRESGEIEQAADIVVFVYRPEYYGINQDEKGEDTRGLAEIIFAKGRNIGIGTIRLRFLSNLTKFKDYENYEESF